MQKLSFALSILVLPCAFHSAQAQTAESKAGTATVSGRELSDAVESDHDTTVENWSQEGPEQGRRTGVRG